MMARKNDVGAQCREIIEQVKAGAFSPVYLLMGDEPYYTDLVCDAIVEHALDEASRDFNETLCYGADVDADAVITAARRYPMMAERQLVVVKRPGDEGFGIFVGLLRKPLDSTVLVLLMRALPPTSGNPLQAGVQDRNGRRIQRPA